MWKELPNPEQNLFSFVDTKPFFSFISNTQPAISLLLPAVVQKKAQELFTCTS